MPEETDPPPKSYALKPKEFEHVNAPRVEAGETPSPAPLANDVFAIQRDLRAREIAAGMDTLKPADRPRSTKRRRDFWLLLLAVNGIFVPLALWGFRTQNAVLAVYALSGAVFLSVGLTWVMWVVVNRY
ncbi:MAG: hypothetical protein C0502_10790 [Opitutus sp.]|nr:hypothetical protein [Opitutus sp.]